MNRQELLNYIQTLSTSKLKNLADYSELGLLPESDVLINVTMADMVNKAMTLANIYFPEWTDRSSNDFGKFLVELFALFSEKDFYYLNMFDREGRLPTMQVYHHAYQRAIELGYAPQLYRTANAFFNLKLSAVSSTTFEPVPSLPFLIKAGSLEIKLNNYLFTNYEPIELFSLTEHEKVVKLFNGKFKKENIEYLGKPLRLLGSNIDVETIKLLSFSGNQVKIWTKTNYFGTYNELDFKFIVLPELNAVNLGFGDGMFGAIPQIGEKFEVTYLQSFDFIKEFPVVATPLEVVKQPNLNNFQGREIIEACQLNRVMSPTIPMESLESIKAKAPLIFSTKSRIINTNDCEGVLNSFPEVLKSKAIFFDGVIHFYVIPKNLNLLNNIDFMGNLNNRLKGSQLLGYSFLGRNTSLVDVRPLELTIYALRGVNLTETVVEVYELIRGFFDPNNLAEYGKDFVFSELVNHIVSEVVGVQNVVIDYIKGSPVRTYAQNKLSLNSGEITKYFEYSSHSIQDFTNTSFNGIKFYCGTTVLNVHYVS